MCKCGYVYKVKSFHLYSIILLFVCLNTQLGLATNIWMGLIFLSYEIKHLLDTVLLLCHWLCILSDLFILDCKRFLFYVTAFTFNKRVSRGLWPRVGTRWTEKLKQGIGVYSLYNILYCGTINDLIVMAEAVFFKLFPALFSCKWQHLTTRWRCSQTPVSLRLAQMSLCTSMCTGKHFSHTFLHVCVIHLLSRWLSFLWLQVRATAWITDWTGDLI